MSCRVATHQGSWYSASKLTLAQQLEGWLAAADQDLQSTPPTSRPIGTIRAIIAPHAGYTYSGVTAAYAYQMVVAARDQVKRIFILGPSHHSSFTDSGLPASSLVSYATPFGNLQLDQAVIDNLHKKYPSTFHRLTKKADEAEHR